MAFDIPVHRVILAISIGLVGAMLASWITLPLPWMLGSMIACTVASVAKVPVGMPMTIRNPMVIVLGVLLGSGFSPGMLNHFGEWAVSLVMIVCYIVAIGVVVYPYFKKVAGYDPVTAYFCSMPGGLNEMVLIGKEMGGDDRRIVLTHASRILIAVLIIPIWFRFSEAIDMSDRAGFGVSITEIPLQDLAILLACGVFGMSLAKVLHLPARLLIGPMLLSAIVHLTGLTDSPPPLELINLAQLIIGVALGCRFFGTPMREVVEIIKYSVGATVLMIALSVFFAFLVHLMAGNSIPVVVLAYAPGGLAEMSLIALALGVDVAFVATHHLFRICLVVIGAPVLFRKTSIKANSQEAE